MLLKKPGLTEAVERRAFSVRPGLMAMSGFFCLFPCIDAIFGEFRFRFRHGWIGYFG
ncbi:hypothetical protein MKY25_13020 [Geobacillus sp. FSL W8-0032]|uniref:hypothetical protein n=1 Tax=Geobacillus TaxID=129337 RepID=UPI0013F4B0FC|nr:hypothetical protein [Geobacillus icigianus]